MHGSGRESESENDYERAWVVYGTFIESEMALFSECSLECASKTALTPPTLSERRFIID